MNIHTWESITQAPLCPDTYHEQAQKAASLDHLLLAGCQDTSGLTQTQIQNHLKAIEGANPERGVKGWLDEIQACTGSTAWLAAKAWWPLARQIATSRLAGKLNAHWGKTPNKSNTLHLRINKTTWIIYEEAYTVAEADLLIIHQMTSQGLKAQTIHHPPDHYTTEERALYTQLRRNNINMADAENLCADTLNAGWWANE